MRLAIRLVTVVASLGLAAVAVAVSASAASGTSVVKAGAAGNAQSPALARGVRPAQFVGAHATNWPSANRVLGPMRSDKIFYPASEPLPARWPANSYGLAPGALAIVAYKVPTKNVLSFVRSIPADREVVMVFWQEPEAHLSSSQFLSEFEAQSRLIHSADRSNVSVASDASVYRYQTWDRSAYDCQYIPPRSYVDYYFADVYEQNDQTLQRDPEYQRWVQCTAHHGRARGLAEYGVGSCEGSAVRAQTIAADAQYLSQNFPYLHVLSYWWDQTESTSCHTDWQFSDAATISMWRALEAGQRLPSHQRRRRS